MKRPTVSQLWIDPSIEGRPMTPEELDREKREVASHIGGREIVAAWVSTDGKSVRYRLAQATTEEER